MEEAIHQSQDLQQIRRWAIKSISGEENISIFAYTYKTEESIL